MPHRTALLLALALALAPAQARALEPWVDFEAGFVAPSYLDVRIPREGGTQLSFSDELKTSSAPAFRIRLGATLGERHTIFALFAPLRLYARGGVDRPVLFRDVTFPPNAYLHAGYRFDSYRLTYRYDFVRTDTWEIGAGVTAKIRDASVSLSSANFVERTDTGFVPLLAARVSWFFHPKAGLLLEADALAAPQGRAEDVLLAVQAKLADNLVARAGYRLLEGGSDSGTVYTFAWLNYGVVGLTATF